MFKTCFCCHIAKPLDKFYRHKGYPLGVDSICRDCDFLRRLARRRAQGIQPFTPFLDRVWDNIKRCEHGDICLYCCWPWRHSRSSKDGYGRLKIRKDGRQIMLRVSHIVYELWHTIPVPHGKLIAHHCDNPPCCNPLHLFPATYQENNADTKRKGRSTRGIRNPMARFTETDIHDMRTLHNTGHSLHCIADLFNTAPSHVSLIVRRKIWTHI